MNVAGIILAAGRSSRMGRPKALLPAGGVGSDCFADRLLARLAPHCSPLLLVLGHDAELIERGLRRSGLATLLRNDAYDLGMLSSLQCGLRALPSGVGHALFTLVDLPAIQEATVAALVAAAQFGSPITLPRYRGRHGHPVLCSRAVIDELLALPVSAAARDVVRRHADETAFVDLPDPGILHDVDDPEAYRAYLEAASA